MENLSFLTILATALFVLAIAIPYFLRRVVPTNEVHIIQSRKIDDLKIIIKIESGTTKNNIFRAVSANILKKSCSFFLAANSESAGNAASEKAIPNNPSGTL